MRSRYKQDGKGNGIHRKIYEKHFGKIPEGYCIHHINRDGFDNRIENLQCVSPEEHLKIHGNYGTFSSIRKWKKALKTKMNNCMERSIRTYCLYEEFGPQISAMLEGVSKRTVYDRIWRLENVY